MSEGQPPVLFWKDLRVLPAYLAILSALTLIAQSICLAQANKTSSSRIHKSTSGSPGSWSRNVDLLPNHTAQNDENATLLFNGSFSKTEPNIEQRGILTFALEILRVLSCLVLFVITIIGFILPSPKFIGMGGESAFAIQNSERVGAQRGNRAGDTRTGFASNDWIVELVLCSTYAYALILASISLTSRLRVRSVVHCHLVLLLLSVFCVYAYRDIWPLATYTLKPPDGAYGWITWSRIGILSMASVMIPLIMPREYVPVDSEHPISPTPEQIASPFSLMFFTFLDPIVATANRYPHLPYNKLPPLADYDHSSYLRATSFPLLDPVARAHEKGTPRHLVFGLMEHFRREYVFMAGLIVARAIFNFASPIGVNRLLNYIENRGESAVVRPWVWVVLLFLSPLVSSIVTQLYIWVSSHISVHIEGIMGQLIFEHSLRIRMTEETTGKVKTSLDDYPTSTMPPSQGPSRSVPQNGPSAKISSVANSSVANSSVANSSQASANFSESNASVHGKQEAPTELSVPVAESVATRRQALGGAKNQNSMGKINNLISTDVTSITGGIDFLYLVFAPLYIVLCVWFLYAILGPSALVGMGLMILGFAIPGRIVHLSHTVQVELMKKTDERVQSVTEAMNVIRMIKMFGWESKIEERVNGKRETELTWIRKKYFLQSMNMVAKSLYLATDNDAFLLHNVYPSYGGTSDRFSKSKLHQVFSSLTVFDMLRNQISLILFVAPKIIQAKVSLDRVNGFLTTTELLDRHEDTVGSQDSVALSNADSSLIGFHNATFTWSRPSLASNPMKQAQRKFLLRIEGSMFFVKNAVNLIVGPTGSGKTSLLLALLGELHLTSRGSNSWFNLPREGGVAYAAQEPWLLNETIKSNILLGETYDAVRYSKVLNQCALNQDLALFDAGDDTEVGERGLTLSGGQKARVSLARAVYSKAEIVLLDDVLSALDVHTARWIVDKCFSGDLLRGRTIILITNSVALTAPIAQFVVSIRSNGTIEHGSVHDILSRDHSLVVKASKEKEETEKAIEITDDGVQKQDGNKTGGKLTVDEEVALGHVSGAALLLHFFNIGGWSFWATFLGALILSEGLTILQTWYLGFWASQYETRSPEEVNVAHYLGLYAVIMSAGVCAYCSGFLVYIKGSLRASRRIHEMLTRSLLRTTLRFLDITPVGRIISRFTRDIDSIDGPLSSTIREWCERTIALLLKLSAIVYMSLLFIFPGLGFFFIGSIVGQIYIRAQLAIKREMSNAKSPVFSHFAAAIDGLTSIRAYAVEEMFIAESLRRIDKYTRPARSFYTMNRWFCIRIDALGGLFSAGLAAYLLYVQDTSNASNTGLQINLAVGSTGMLLWWVRATNELEVQGNSLERIQAYSTIEQEPQATDAGKTPAYWPSSGDIAIDNLSARYSSGGPDVLHRISVEIKSGEKVGVVGRTGSGKSSFALGLLRLIPTSGQVVIDGLRTHSINLEALRGAVTIIPQQPELLSGTIRENLDPFDQHDDVSLNDALRAAGLFDLQRDVSEDQRIALDSTVTGGGRNLSVGQRQILALARALVRKSKVLILDEATASLDHKTDSVVQRSLGTEFKGCTLITVAHRLDTIMNSDKILVLDGGQLVEFDSPQKLLQIEEGYFRFLVDESGDKDALYALATSP